MDGVENFASLKNGCRCKSPNPAYRYQVEIKPPFCVSTPRLFRCLYVLYFSTYRNNSAVPFCNWYVYGRANIASNRFLCIGYGMGAWIINFLLFFGRFNGFEGFSGSIVFWKRNLMTWIIPESIFIKSTAKKQKFKHKKVCAIKLQNNILRYKQLPFANSFPGRRVRVQECLI